MHLKSSPEAGASAAQPMGAGRPSGRSRATIAAASALLAAALAACGGGAGSDVGTTSAAASEADTSVFLATQAGRVSAAAVTTRLRLLRSDLLNPWGLAFLPDGRILVTEKGGRLKLLPASGVGAATLISGLRPLADVGQGGLLDVALPPDYPTDPYVYWTYTEPEADGYRLAVARGRLSGTQLTEVRRLMHSWPRSTSSSQFGSRLAFGRDGKLYIGVGDRRIDDPAAPNYSNAQSPWTENGKVLRINLDGTLPTDNPSINGGKSLRTLYTVGHRNPQGLAVHPTTGQLWEVEHGPQGGDELNLIQAGKNYGWPIVSYGCVYGASIGAACRVGGGVHAPRFQEPVATWVPVSTAPSSLMFYNGTRFPEWNGSALIGALAGQAIWRVSLNGTTESGREKIVDLPGERFRDVVQGRDGWVYTITDSGKLYRIER